MLASSRMLSTSPYAAALPAPATPTMMRALASGVAGGAASGVAGPSPEPGTGTVCSCAVLGMVAHAIAVLIHKRTAALGGPVTGSLRGSCGTAAQRIACTFQPCGTRASPRAICLGIICRASLRIQTRGRDGRCGAGSRAHSLTGGHGTGCSHRNCGSKGHCSYQGDCRHVRMAILVPSFHLAPLSTCQGRRLVLCGGFCPLHSQYDSGRRFLARDFKYF